MKWVTLDKTGHIYRHGSHLIKWVTSGEIVQTLGHTYKNGSNLKKWVTFGEMGHTCKKSCHIWRNGENVLKWVTFEKWVRVDKMSRI